MACAGKLPKSQLGNTWKSERIGIYEWAATDKQYEEAKRL